MNDRIKAIRSRVLTTPGVDDPGREAIWAESYARTVGEPTVIRVAKATADYFRRRAVVIQPGELIVGSPAATKVAADAELEVDILWPDEPPTPRLSQTYLDTAMMMGCGNHQTIDYQTVLAIGFGGLIERIDRRRAEIGEGEAEKRDFLTALRIMAEGYIDFCRRYAGLAGDLAEQCADPVRRDELQTIAANCRQVIEGPPESFRQACQAVWFAFFFVPDSPGRIDQYLYPYYRRDIDRGILRREQAKELLCCLWAKYQEWFGASEPRTGNHHLVLGGVDADGRDATNELSYLCLDVAEELALPRPQVGVRWHQGTPHEFLPRAVAVLRAGMGSPNFCSDEQIVPALMAVGVAEADARNFSLSGCHEVMVSGKSQMGSVEGMFNAPKMLRVALGLEPEIAPGVTPAAIDSYEKLWQAVVSAMRDTVAAMHEYSEYLDSNRAVPAGAWLEASLVTQGCIENARGLLQGGAVYNYCNWDAIGIANLADSLAAVRQLVFEQQRLTLAELVDVLRADWAGHEPLRQAVAGSEERFGNDNDVVDTVAADIIRTLAELLKTKTPFRGGLYTLGTLAGYENAHVEFGTKTGATPDGRRAGESFASSLAPAPGRDRRGVTAMLNSVAKMPHRLLPTSTTVNLSLDRRLLDDDTGVAKIASLIEGHFRSGGQQCQFTFYGRDELLQARAEPEKHGHVMVRVAGYSAPFVTLDEVTQDEIIARTGYAL